MMNYEVFKDVVVEKFLGYLPEEFQDMQVVVTPITKVNRTLDGLTVRGEASHISPTLYLNYLYEEYTASEDLDAVLKGGADTFMEALEQSAPISVSELEDRELAKDMIVMQFVGTAQNQDLLATMPHRDFLDLSIIYRRIVRMDEGGIASIPIKTNYAEKLGFSEEQLFELASKNTKRLLPPVVTSMNDVIRKIFMKDGMPPEIADMMLGEMPPEQQMYVISNNKGINGAVSMLYEDGLHDLAEKLGSDLYIMPSSIHEVIAVSTDLGNPNELAAMVAEINVDQVALDERLSNQVYHYDKDLRKVTLATDTPNKRLDGIVAEAPMVYEAGKTR